MPGYCPELNPDELLSQDVKTNSLGKSRPTHQTELLGTVHRHLHRRQKQPQVIKNLIHREACSLCGTRKYALFGGRLSFYGKRVS
jgi:hypothetical protein